VRAIVSDGLYEFSLFLFVRFTCYPSFISYLTVGFRVVGTLSKCEGMGLELFALP
jgi:hypothetical protein